MTSDQGTVVTSRRPAIDGLPQALGAYVAWGVIPLYFHLLKAVPAIEVVCWRVIFTLPVVLIAIHLRHQHGDLRAALANRRVLGGLMLSAALIAANWLLYVWAVGNGHVLAASLGYYLNPLINVALGTVFFRERLRPRQWLAVGIAAAGIALLLAGAAQTLAIALGLALSFAGYGLVRKLVPVGAVPGLTIETILLLVPAIAAAVWFGTQPAGSSLLAGGDTTWLLVGCGPVTALPLVLFAIAARRMDLSLLGMVQFVSPTIAFVIGLFVFHETLNPLRLAAFVAIWVAIAVFCLDLVRPRAASA